MYDALHALLTNGRGNVEGSKAEDGNVEGGTAEDGKAEDGNLEDVTHASGRGRDRAPQAPAVRNMLHVSITVDDESAAQIRAATVGGKGYLPTSVLEKYGCSTMIGGTVFSESGEVLWFGRTRRHATPAQFAALIARDGGCVKCGADPSRCQAHHIMPFNAPVQGKTDIDELALMCADDHQWIHEQHLTLYWQLGPPDPQTGKRKRVWLTRPATADEIAPDRSHESRHRTRSNAERQRPETNRTNTRGFADAR